MRIIVTLLLVTAVRDVRAFDENQPFRYRASKKWSPAFSNGLDQALATVQKDLAQGTFDPQAEKLLAAAETYTKGVFNAPTLKLAKAITLRKGGDILLAEWRLQESFGNGSLFLFDHWNSSDYEFRLTGCGIQSRADLTAFLSKLIAWHQPPANFAPKSLEVGLPDDEPVISRFSGTTHFASTDGPYNFNIRGVLRHKDWLIRVTFGKGLIRGYPVLPFIPERFPPLVELARSWSFNRVWGEVGGNYASAGGMSDHRDKVLVAELIRRGITGEQVVELLYNTDPANLGDRADVVLTRLEQSGRQTSIKEAFAGALTMYERIGVRADRAAEVLFRAAGRNCAPEFESNALRLLKAGMFQTGALVYLMNCSASEDTLQALQSVSAPQNAVLGKEPLEPVRSAIRRRLERSPQAK